MWRYIYPQNWKNSNSFDEDGTQGQNWREENGFGFWNNKDWRNKKIKKKFWFLRSWNEMSRHFFPNQPRATGNCGRCSFLSFLFLKPMPRGDLAFQSGIKTIVPLENLCNSNFGNRMKQRFQRAFTRKRKGAIFK